MMKVIGQSIWTPVGVCFLLTLFVPHVVAAYATSLTFIGTAMAVIYLQYPRQCIKLITSAITSFMVPEPVAVPLGRVFNKPPQD